MAKKPRSQRRKKGKGMGGDDDGGDDGVAAINNNNKMDALSDTHTVADFDSITTFESDIMLYDGNVLFRVQYVMLCCVCASKKFVFVFKGKIFLTSVFLLNHKL